MGLPQASAISDTTDLIHFMHRYIVSSSRSLTCTRPVGLVMGSVLVTALSVSFAQAPFPPVAAVQATTAQAALAALSVPQAEASTYVMLDLPEVASPGMIKARIGSEYPGTSMLVLVRLGSELTTSTQLPPTDKTQAAPRAVPGGAPPRTAAPTRPSPTSTARPGPRPMPSLVVARKIAPGEPALLNIEFEITRTQRYAVYAFAQGRWFIAEREVKVGQDGSHR